MTPDIIVAISGALTATVTLVTACIVVRQVREMRRATHATAFKAVYDMLQADSCRADRAFVMKDLATKSLESWTPDARSRAERVCQNYDCVGIMCRQGFIPVAVVADSWGDSFRRTWAILAPLAASYRVTRNSKESWDDYEWLAAQAEGFRQKIHG